MASTDLSHTGTSASGAETRSSQKTARFDLTWLIPAVGVVILGLLVVFPLFFLFQGSFQEQVGPRTFAYTLRNYIEAYTTPQTYTTFRTSVVFALGSALLGLVLSCVLAWLVERTNVPMARWFILIAVVPLVLPSVIETIAWIFLLTPNTGYVNVALRSLFGLSEPPFNVFSMAGMIWVQGVGQVPIGFLLMSAAFKLMDPSLEEAAMTSGSSTWQTIHRVTLRLLLPAILSAFLLMMVRSLEAFEVPAIIGVRAREFVYTTEIFLSFRTAPPNYGRGAALSMGLFVLTAIGVWAYQRATRNAERFQTVSGKAFRPRQFDLGRARWPAFAVLALYAVVVVVLPLLIILWVSFLPFFAPPRPESLELLTLNTYQSVLSDARFVSSLRNSTLLAVGSATVVMLLTSIIGWLIYKSRMRGAKALEFLAFMPITIPGLVLGMALILMYASVPIGIYGTIWVLLIAYTTKALPYGLRFASGSIIQIHRELEEAASAAGASWWQSFRRVTLPLLRPGLAAGWIYVCIVSFRELSASALLATGENSPLAVHVLLLYDNGRTTGVAAVGVIMIAVLLTIVGIFYKLTGRIGIRA